MVSTSNPIHPNNSSIQTTHKTHTPLLSLLAPWLLPSKHYVYHSCSFNNFRIHGCLAVSRNRMATGVSYIWVLFSTAIASNCRLSTFALQLSGVHRNRRLVSSRFLDSNSMDDGENFWKYVTEELFHFKESYTEHVNGETKRTIIVVRLLKLEHRFVEFSLRLSCLTYFRSQTPKNFSAAETLKSLKRRNYL